MLFHLLIIMFFAVAIPPSVKVLAVVGAVYGILQSLKKVPVLAPYLTGWIAMILNVALSVLGTLVTIPADQLYTQGTLNALVTVIITSLSAAGIHGTVKSMSPPKH